MHERALMVSLMRKIEEVAAAQGSSRVTRVVVRLGALSHFTIEHFREHFVDAARGTVADGAEIEAVVDRDVRDPRAGDVVLESIDVETLAPEEARS